MMNNSRISKQLPSSQLPSSQLPLNQLPSSQLPSSQLNTNSLAQRAQLRALSDVLSRAIDSDQTLASEVVDIE